MKTSKSLLILIGFILITIHLEAQISASLTFDPSDLQFDTIGIYTQPSFPGCHFTDIVGAPNIPIITKQYVLPKNAEITSINIYDSVHHSLQGSFLIYPTQNPIILDGRPAPPFVEPDTLYYNSHSRFNGNIIEIESISNVMGFNLAKIKIYPLQYIPADSTLIFFDNIRFSINFQITGTDPLFKKLTSRQYNEITDYLTQTIDNPEDIEASGPICEFLEPAYKGTRPLNLSFLPWAGGDNVEYIIITNDQLKGSFDILAEWKMGKGIPSLVVTTSQIEEYYPGFDLAEKIFNYLKEVNNYWTDAIYILLGGDTEIIPARIGFKECRDGSCYLRVTDLYYSDVDTANYHDPTYNWNKDGDGDFWDEDNTLELGFDNFLGRAPVKNIEEANNFVDKILQYEQNKLSICINKNTLIGADIDDLCGGSGHGMVLMNEVFNSLPSSPQINTTRIYDDYSNWGGDYQLNQENVISALNGDIQKGSQHIFGHIDHSGFSSLGTSQRCNNSRISIQDMDNLELDDGEILKIMYSSGCEPNEFDKDCIAEHFINGSGINNKTGIGVGFIGNSGAGRDSDEQCKTFFEKLYKNPMVNLGKIFNATRDAEEEYGVPRKRSLNFLGDPELPVWTNNNGDPLEITYTPNSLTTGVNDLVISIDNLSPLEQAFVCISKDDEIYGADFTNGSWGTHEVTFNCVPDTPGQLQIKATAPNHLFAEDYIDVNVNTGPDHAHLYVKEFYPTNLYLNRGVNTFKIVLENSGKAISATGITSILTTNSTYASITQGESGYNNIVPGTSQASTSEFEITITESAMDQLFIPLTLTITTDQGLFKEEFFLQIRAPFLTYRGNKIISSGNDIFIDPGELATFKVELLNSGCMTAKAISATITEDSDDLQIVEGFDTVYFRPMGAHDTAWCNGIFQIQVTNELPPVGSLDLNLTLDIDYDGITGSFPIRLNNKLSPGNISFTSTDSYITLNWTKNSNSEYNVYRLDPDSLLPGEDIEDSTLYKRLNFYINKFSSYTDVDVEPAKVYYYKLTCYRNDGLPQGPFTPAFKAWTTIPSLEPWPIFIPDYGTRSEGSPILYNAIPSRFEAGDNPELEIFFPMDDGTNPFASKSALYAFYSNGDELYNIDQNITFYAGFANFTYAGMKATPIIGEMNGNDAFGEVAFATTYGDPPSGQDAKKLFIYSSGDEANPPGVPDLLWQPLLNQAVKGALVGSKLSPDGEVKIITAELWNGILDVRNTSDGTSYLSPSWPITMPGNPEVVSIPVAADLDLVDSYKEIIIGYPKNENGENIGVYVFKHDGNNYINPPGVFYLPQVTDNLVGLDCRPVVAELDIIDNNPEIILLSAYSDKKAHVFALNHDRSPVTNWNYDQHIIDISRTDNGAYPALTVADLDNNGIIEVLIADAGKIYAWKATGEYFNDHFPIEVEGLECPYVAPLVANVDKDPECEIIIADPVNNFIFAFNPDGSQVPGWPLAVEGLMATPAIGDINHDGLNEIVAVYGGYVNVWKTEGETGHDEWPLYRLNSFNNAVYTEPACDYDPNNPLVYDHETNEIDWDGYNVLSRDLIIPDGEVLTIRGRVAMPDGAKIIVQRGGRLNVAGGVITSACGGLWAGIEVWGYSDKSQLDEQYPPGIVELCENAMIKNAKCAIATIKKVNGVNDYAYTGGIVWCKDAKFLNNIYGVRFYNYRNFNPNSPGYEINNRSSVKNCIFETNGRLADPGKDPKAFIRLDDVVGIKLNGNQYINSTGDTYPWDQRGIGIESYNAAYAVDQICKSTPCGDDGKRNFFNNLHYGIRAFGQGRENGTVSLMHSDFYFNENGLFISYINNAQVQFNTCTIPEISYATEIPRYGLYIEYSSGYSIEENTFTGFNNGPDGNIGMYISNSGNLPNEIYKNDFSSLAYGIVALGVNRGETGEGLCLKCNNFSRCTNDIHVIPEIEDGRWKQGRDQGIASSQGTTGSDTAPAGNTFTDVEVLPSTWNYFNHDYCNFIYYHHHQPPYPTGIIIKPYPYSDEMVRLIQEDRQYQDEDQACPSNFGGGGLDLSIEKSKILLENNQTTIYSDSIQTLKDGGDTYSLNLDVVTSTTDETYQVRQQLLDESPYLSDTVMKSAIYKENVLPSAMLRDVLIANPQSAKSTELLEKIEARINPMPDEMMSEILQGRNVEGNLEVLEAKLAEHKAVKYKSLYKLESLYKQDTLDFQGSMDSLVNLWSGENDASILYKLAFLYLDMNDSLNCFSTLNSIPQQDNMSPVDLVEFEDFSELFNIIWQLKDGKSCQDSLIELQLTNLSSKETKPASLASNLLIAHDLIDYCEPIYLADNLKSAIVISEKIPNKISVEERLKIFPNPAKDYVIISYDLLGLSGNFQIIVSSLEGKPIFQRKITGIINQCIISTEKLSSSLYFIQLANDNKTIESKSFLITR